MAEQITREDALTREGYRHACHIMLYGDSSAKLFGKIPIKHIVLMQMRFDGLLGFPGGLVNPFEETLEAGLSRELHEEVGVAVPVGVDNHVSSCLSPSCPRLITHFYVKKMTESELKEIESSCSYSHRPWFRGIRYVQSAPLLPQEWRWSPLFPVPLVHQQLSGPAALCPAALRAAVPGGAGEGCETG